jgi:hypothetical protein
MELRSPAFEPGGEIPRRYTKDGDNVPPPLAWHDVPGATRELVLTLVDIRARQPRPFTHWVVYGLSPERADLPEGVAHHEASPPDTDIRQGRNDLENVGYDGPQPPKGSPHEYHFTLLALDTTLDAEPGLGREELEARVGGHVLARAELVGRYARPS